MSLTPFNLRVDDDINPVGIDARPYFGWHLKAEEPEQRQTHYRIKLSLAPDCDDNLVWDSGQRPGDTQNHVVYEGPPLAPHTRYYWTVATQNGRFAEPATFLTGLFTAADWSGAEWVRRSSSEPDDYTYYRHRFWLPDGEITRATVFITAVHKYELTLNERPIGHGPAYHYPQYQYYNGFDVTGEVMAAYENLLAVLVHWFGGGQGRPASARGLLLKLVVVYADGREIVVGTNGRWRCHRATRWVVDQPPRHPHEGIGYVEHIDARTMITDWSAHRCEDQAWPTVTVLGPHPTSPWTGNLRSDLTRIVEYPHRPERIWTTADGRTLIDLGRVLPGRPQINFAASPENVEVKLQGGYTLHDDETINLNHNQGTDLRFRVTTSGRPFTFLPQEYLGMRYLEITAAPHPITADNFVFVVRHTALDGSGSSFITDDPLLNEVWSLFKRSIPVGAQEQFLDTPTREKGGFLVDSFNESLVAMAAYGERLLTRRVLQEFLDSMDQYWASPADWGRMNAVYPNGDGARDIPDFTQAYLIWVWLYYIQSGDSAFLRHHYDKLKAIADFVNRHRRPETGLIHQLTGGGDGMYQHGIIDWPPSMRYGHDMSAEARTVINVYAAIGNRLMSHIAAVAGQETDRQYYREAGEALQAAINHHLLTDQDIYCDGLLADGRQSPHVSQLSNSLPLGVGIAPIDKQPVISQYVQSLGLRAGMPTIHWLIRAAGEMDLGEYLLDLYTRDDWDGWAKNIALGATCTWEGWDADRQTDQSLSHPWGAIGLIGLQHYVLGVRPLGPQYSRFLVKPLFFGRRLSRASGIIPTERGEIAVSWVRENGRYNLNLTAPPNTRASIYLPLSSKTHAKFGEVGSGSYQFSLAKEQIK